jgi:hypothetical protein
MHHKDEHRRLLIPRGEWRQGSSICRVQRDIRSGVIPGE